MVTALYLAGCTSEPGERQPSAQAQIEEPEYLACPGGDDGVCEAEQKQAREEWPKALKGDYQSERNVAFTFSQGQNVANSVRRPVQGCAWRMEIMASGSAQVDATDLQNFRIECGKLTREDLAAAKAVAELISRRVHGSALGKLPKLQCTADDGIETSGFCKDNQFEVE